MDGVEGDEDSVEVRQNNGGGWRRMGAVVWVVVQLVEGTGVRGSINTAAND